MTTARGGFQVTLTPQPADPREGADFLSRLTIDKLFSGDVSGSSIGQMVAARGSEPASAGYAAIERVTGTLHGRRGSFILQHSGRSSAAGQSLDITVIADTGTGELTGISGSMQIIIAEGRHSYVFDYELPGA